MSRPILQTIVSGGLRTFDRISAPARAEAHCDIPCGIYDPHLMQIGALTVLRMTQLVEALGDDAAKTKSNLSRYIEVKEEHAELVKREVRIIWGDYFKVEHLEKFPDLNTTVWEILKLAGKNKQEISTQFAQDLLGMTQKFAEMFWESKGVATKRQPSNQAMGGELVVPA